MDDNQLNREDYAYWVKLAAITSTSVAFTLVIIKVYAWIATDSSAMLASTTDSLLDLFASLMNVVILRVALAPADEQHTFGHGKAESLAGLVQAAFVLGSGSILIFHGVERFIVPQTIVQSSIGITVTIISIVLTLALVLFQRFVMKKTDSVVISADALHYQSDLLLNLGVLAAIILSSYWLQADGVFTLCVGIFLVIGAGKIVWVSVHHLMDHQLDEEALDLIKKIVKEHKQAIDIHDLRTRQSGPDRFIQFHLELDNTLSLVEAHKIGEELELQIKQQLSPCEVFIHHDPSSVVK